VGMVWELPQWQFSSYWELLVLVFAPVQVAARVLCAAKKTHAVTKGAIKDPTNPMCRCGHRATQPDQHQLLMLNTFHKRQLPTARLDLTCT
jgi:hypothetical protein